jgi:hypothetical protein
MDEPVRLEVDEVPPGRAFTHPDRTATDLALIARMGSAVRRILHTSPVSSDAARPLTVAVPEPGPRQHRAIVCHARLLRAPVDHGFVGFFAERREGLDHSPLTAADDELIHEFPDHPGILSYSSLELSDGNWGNLILLHPAEASERWREGARHAWAVRELAPRHYTVIRLHQGRFPGGVLADRPVLLRTTYHDFRGPTPWRAVRELTTGP